MRDSTAKAARLRRPPRTMFGTSHPIRKRRPREPFSLSWPALGLGSWLLLSGLAILRLVASFVRGFRVVSRSTPLDDPTLGTAATRAVSRLGLATVPELRSSAGLHCPSVWCWARRPILLVPTKVPDRAMAIDWIAVFSHELAHWRRLDHIAALVGQVLTCVLPWNPLAWWTRVRLGQLAELACDDWVLASGSAGTDYAASLLELVPQRGTCPALAAVSSRSGLVGRIKHILEERPSSPAIGMRWTLLALTLTALAMSIVALAQARTVVAHKPSVDTPVAAPAGETVPAEAASMKHALRVNVTDKDGKPVRDASVLWIGIAKPALGYAALPHDNPERNGPRRISLAKTQTDEHGLASVSGEFDSSTLDGSQILVSAPGFGFQPHSLRAFREESEVQIRLAKEAIIQGRLADPSRNPRRGGARRAERVPQRHER